MGSADKSYFALLPLLPFRRRNTVLALVVLLFHIAPVSRKHRASTGLETLYHGPAFVFVPIGKDLLEKSSAGIDAIVIVVFEHVVGDFFVQLIPIMLILGR